jgi:hypothetical protein
MNELQLAGKPSMQTRHLCRSCIVFALFILACESDPHRSDVDAESGRDAKATRESGQVAKFLIEAGANVNALDGEGRTPLFYAKAPGASDQDVIDLLQDNGGQYRGRIECDGKTCH